MSSTYAELVAALEALPPTPRIVASGNGAIPYELLRIVDATLPEFTLNMLAAHPGLPMREGITHETSFVGPGMRKSPHLSYVPARLSMVPLLFGRTLPPDAVIAHTSLPHGGRISLGIETNVVVGAIEACKARGGTIIAQANAQMPYTFGDSEFDVEDFDIVYEVDLPVAHYAERRRVTAGAADLATIGSLAAARIQDGSTLQMGIGNIPTPSCPSSPTRRGWRSGRRCSPTGCSACSKRARWTRIGRSSRPSRSAAPSSIGGCTATSGCSCVGPRRPTTPRTSPANR